MLSIRQNDLHRVFSSVMESSGVMAPGDGDGGVRRSLARDSSD